MINPNGTAARLAVATAAISLLSGLVGFASGIVSLVFGGWGFLGSVLSIWALGMPVMIADVAILWALSPNRDLLHYPRSAATAIARRRAARTEEAAARTPEGRTWSVLLAHRAGLTTTSMELRRDLRTRADAMAALLAGSIDPADVEARVLLVKTVAEVGSAYEDALARNPPDDEAARLHATVDATLKTIVAAAETRRAASDLASSDAFGATIGHATAFAQRVAGSARDPFGSDPV